MAHRRSNAAVYIDRTEGDFSSTDDDEDLDAADFKDGQVRLQRDLASSPTKTAAPNIHLSSLEDTGSDTATDDNDTDNDDNVPDSPRTRRGHALNNPGETHDKADNAIDWSSEDDLLPASRKRKRPQHTDQPLTTLKPRKRKPTQIAGGIVGKKERKQKQQFQKPRNIRSDSDTDDDRLEREMPQYLKDRRASFNAAQEDLMEAGLRLPPVFDDIDFSDDDRLAELAEKPVMTNMSPRAPYQDLDLPDSKGVIPAPVAQWLHPYQVDGIGFLHKAFVYQRGVILGDDMGLGKTIQVIGFLLAAFGKTGDERDAKRMRKYRRLKEKRWYPRILLICPGSLMDNWADELEKWSWFSTDRFHLSNKLEALQAAKSGRLEIMITTYTTYTHHREMINAVEWDAVIADEVHSIKTWKAESTQAMNEVNAMCRIGLTGTAIQNNYEELWTLLNWANPGRLGPRKVWKTHISEPLKLGQSHDATDEQLALARTTAKKLAFNLLPRFFLRRTKKLIAHQLPKKTDRVVFCPLTDPQKDAYVTYINSHAVELIRTATEPCACGSKKKSGWCCHQRMEPDGPRWQSNVFPAMVTCQKIASHLAMLVPSASDPQDMQQKALENLQEAVPHHWRAMYAARDRIESYASPSYCGKWSVLQRLLQFWYDAGDTKVLIFSHSVRLLKMFRQLFVARSSFTLSYLDGAMSYADRTAAVNDFNSDPNAFAFLISTRAGGVGLNITSANKVVILDPNWNPAHDLQAQDRAYRLGQRRDVEVFRLVSAGTIEEIVYARQIYKQQQASIAFTAANERRYFKGVQDRRDQKGEIFGLANLFAFQADQVVLQGIVNKLNVAEARAGLAIAGLDLDSGFDEADPALPSASGRGRRRAAEDEAMQAVASLISQGLESEPDDEEAPKSLTKKKEGQASAISAILARAGVAYSHDTSDVLGSSRVEAKLSARALEGARGGRVFAASSQTSPPSSRHGRLAGEVNDLEVHANSGREREEGGGGRRRRYHPPAAVRRRQFCSLARTHGFEGPEGVTRFALLVEGWSARRRGEVLEAFYRARDPTNDV